jgi:hypothetical protein
MESGRLKFEGIISPGKNASCLLNTLNPVCTFGSRSVETTGHFHIKYLATMFFLIVKLTLATAAASQPASPTAVSGHHSLTASFWLHAPSVPLLKSFTHSAKQTLSRTSFFFFFFLSFLQAGDTWREILARSNFDEPASFTYKTSSSDIKVM